MKILITTTDLLSIVAVRLLLAKDHRKDQTFFLSQILQENLRKVMFPLGDLTKSEVKQIAVDAGLRKIAEKPESMGICFIGSRDFQDFIEEVNKFFVYFYRLYNWCASKI